MLTLPARRTMAAALRHRDETYDGVFWVGVRTTRIFCRPSCPARLPRRENVAFFESTAAARAAGLQPCRRCRPEGVGRYPGLGLTLLERVEREPARRWTAQDLRRLGVDPVHFGRWFRRTHGMTFQTYVRERRLGLALDSLRAGAALDQVILESGFESHSGFRTAFTRTFGRPPGQSRTLECITVTWIQSPIGRLIGGVTNDRVCLLEYGDRRFLPSQLDTLRRRFDRAVVPGGHPLLGQLAGELDEYFSGRRSEFSVPLALPGTPFQAKVWSALRCIPVGTTCSYEALARTIGMPRAVRAVGRANGANPVAIIVPCHRVVPKSGGLGGYGGGLWRKRRLLDLEHAQPGSYQ